MDPGAPRARRPRPVADAPINELLSRTDELAKGWLLALLERVSLHEAGGVPTAAIANDGPRICAAALRALTDDRDLARLAAGGVLESLVAACAGFAGQAGPGGALQAVDALHAVLWSALHDELRRPEPDLVSELAERLGAVTELIRAAAVRASSSGPGPGPRGVAAPATAPAPQAVPPAGGSAPDEGPSEPAAVAIPEPVPLAPVHRRPVAVSEDALWVAALDDEVTRSQRTGSPLSLLLIELGEGERLLAAEPPTGAAAIIDRFAHAVRSVLRRQDLLASEAQTRVWVIARDTARPGARALGDRVAEAVAAAEPVRGAPLAVNVGLAVLGEDAHDRRSLMEAAEEAAFAAAANGEQVAEVGAPPESE